MTRKGCTCPQCVPPERSVAAAEFARCPKGHSTVELVNGRNLRGPYVSARCTTPGCGERQTYYVSAADRAAHYAHDHHVTRVAAARKFGTSTEAVIAAWELLYPTKRRDLT